MQASLAELARLVNGNVRGDASLVVTGASPLRDAREGEITLVDQAGNGHLLSTTGASAVVAPRGLDDAALPVIEVDDVHAAFAAIVSHFRPRRRQRRIGVGPAAIISPTAKLGYDVDVHPGATIGDDVRISAGSTIHAGAHIMAGCEIGEYTTIYPGAVLYEDTVVGSHVVIHGGAVIGADGFGYTQVDGRHQLSAQLGNVVIGDHVEIGAGVTIDRGAYGPTTIGEGTKIDNQVMIAHNCRIGRHNMLCSQVGVAGSTTTGDYVVMAGQAGVCDHLHIGDGAILGARAAVMNDVPPGARMIGVPASLERDHKLRLAVFKRLPEMRRQLKKLERLAQQLKQRLDDEGSSDREADATDSQAAA